MSICVVSGKDDADFYRSLRIAKQNFVFCSPSRIKEYLNRLNSDLVILDCGFQAEDGIKTMKILKKARPEIPIIFITNVGSEEIVLKAFRNSARDFFAKPINIADFEQTVLGILSVRRTTKEQRTPFFVAYEDEAEDAGASLKKHADLGLAIAHIQKNYSGDMNLEGIANKMNISKYHFCRTFKKRVGMSPKKFITYIRMKAAKELLKKNMSISMIAAEVGYNDISSFIEQFKKYTGMTPSVFKKTLK